MADPHNSGSTEADDPGLARGTCFAANGLELAAVVWFWWCVFDCGETLFFRFFTSRTHGLRHVPGSLASFTSLDYFSTVIL